MTSAPIRILILVRSLLGGGAEVAAVRLATWLAAAGHTVTIVTLYDDATLDVPPSVGVVTTSKRGRYDVTAIVRFVRRVRSEPADVVVGVQSTMNLLALLGRTRPVWMVQSMPGGRSMTKLGRVLVWMEHRLHRRAAVVVSLSHRVAAELAGRGIDTQVVPNPVPVLPPLDRHDVDRRGIVIVGRLDPVKGHGVLIESMAIIGARGYEVRLVVLGDSSVRYASLLQPLVQAHGLGGLVTHVPFNEHPSEVLARSAALVCSSWSEGGPNVVVEALALGLPCVSTDVGDAGRMIGDAGLVVPPGDAEALASAIVELLDDLDRFSERARVRSQWIEDVYSPDAVGAQLLAVIEGVVARA